MKNAPRLYTAFTGLFLLLQGTSTLLFYLFPALDQAFPQLLNITQMVPSHSLLHISSGLIALAVLSWGGPRGAFWYALGFGGFYTALALLGLMTGLPTELSLQPFDHPFHFLLGGLGLLVAGLDYPRRASL